MSAVTKHREENWGDYGPAMRALSKMQRDFVRNYVAEAMVKTYGAGVRAAAAAGYKADNRATLSKAAHIMVHDRTKNEKVIAAIAEESRRMLRIGHPEAVGALFNLIHKPDHPGHVRAIHMLLERVDPVIAHHDIAVTHRHINEDEEGLEELRAMRQLDVTRKVARGISGENGLARLERLEAADSERRAASAKTIAGERVE